MLISNVLYFYNIFIHNYFESNKVGYYYILVKVDTTAAPALYIVGQ